MLFHVTWEFTEMTESSEPRQLEVFAQWQFPDDIDVKAFYGFADCSGGMAIVDIQDVTALARTTATWVPWLRFSSTPIAPAEEMLAIRGEAIEFRRAVS